MKQLNQKTPWVFRLGVALLCVMLMTTHFTGNLYARYSTTATGSDSARVAKFAGGTITPLTDVWSEKVTVNDGEGYWPIEASFEVDFELAEVTRKVTLTLSLEKVHDSGTIEVAGEPTFVCSGTILKRAGGKCRNCVTVDNVNKYGYYCATGSEIKQNIRNITISDSRFQPVDNNSSNNTEIIITGELSAGSEETVTVHVVYFVPSNADGAIESAALNCELICEQVD